MKARAYFPSIKELFSKKTDYVKSSRIISNGEGNDYPQMIERLHENSITSKQCHKLFKTYLTGKGFGQLNELIVNHFTGLKLLNFLDLFNDDYALHYGAAVHVQYRIDGKKDRFKVIPFSNVRKGKEDSEEYSGKYAVSSNWLDEKNNIKWYHSFNDNIKVVQDQIKQAGGINKYTGQLFFFNPSRYTYPIAPINPVINDADSEFRIGIFRNKNLRKGVFGKKIFVIPPVVSPELRELSLDNLTPEQSSTLINQKRILSEYQKSLNAFVGVENNEGFMTLEMEFEGDDISKAINVIDIKTDIDDKMFKNSEERIPDNIRRAYNNIPHILVANKESGVFSDSAALLEAAKVQYQENTKEERMLVEQAFRKLFNGFDPVNTTLLNIETLIEEEIIQAQEQDVNALSQATLRGSVGGVTALLQIQQSVAQGTTDFKAGVAMIREIYGFDEATSREILGTPDALPPPSSQHNIE